MECRNKRQYYCQLCHYKCSLKSRLEDHIRTHTREKPWTCEQCNRSFAAKLYLTQQHVRFVHQQPKKVHKCSLCSYATGKKCNLEYHTRTHTGERSFPCDQSNCDHVAKSFTQLKVHNVNKHTTELKFGCQFPNCGYRGKTKSAVSRHVRTTHSDFRPFVCDFEWCSYRFKTKLTLKRHKLSVHHGGNKPFACSLCSYRAISKSYLKVHKLKHSEEKRVKCHVSGCTFSCKLQKHLQSHVMHRHTEKTLKCDIAGCSYSAADGAMLSHHKQLAHCEKVHKCPICDYRAPTPKYVQTHVDRHHTIQRFSCPYKGCNFQARFREHFNMHIRCHKENLGCPLEGCDYAASSKSAFERHMKLHDSTGRPFQCHFCHKYFSFNSQLSKHLRSHKQEMPFKCPACNFEAVYKKMFTRHVRAIHSRAFPNFVLMKKLFAIIAIM